MKELLQKILGNYASSKNEKMKNNILANYIRNEPDIVISKAVSIDKSKYKIEGSAGKGNWADIPWIAVFDREITTTATKGYDIVYLFCADMTGVYLSLNQGWTYFKDRYGVKDGKKKIQHVSSAWRNLLSSTLTDFSFDDINLKSHNNSDLATGYELGHICGKYYSALEMPETAELAEDLRNLTGVYRELKGHIIDASIEKTNDLLIVNSELGLIEAKETDDEFEGIESNIENYEQSTLTYEEIPDDFISKNQESYHFDPKKIDFFKKAKNQKKLGLAGELMALNYERAFLTKNGQYELAKKIRHVSVDDGDGAGYDILSFNLNGQEKYIEVKTTTGESNSPFIISANEIEFSRQNNLKYYLYYIEYMILVKIKIKANFILLKVI